MTVIYDALQKTKDFTIAVVTNQTKVEARDSNDQLIPGAYGTLGTDDTAVIQSAINNLLAGRTYKQRVVIIGNYVLTDTLLLPSYTTLSLFGKCSLQAGLAKDLVRNSNPAGGQTQIEVLGGEWVGNNKNATPGSGIYLGNVTEAKVLETMTRACAHVGIYMKGCHRSYVDRNLTKDCGAVGGATVGTGIAWLGGQRNWIGNNVCMSNNVGGSIQAGIQIEADDEFGQGVFNDSVIKDNRIYSNSGPGIIYSNCNRVRILQNDIGLNGKEGIAGNISAFMKIAKNILSDNSQAANTTYDEITGSINRSQIEDNTLYSSAGNPRARNGIVLANDAQTYNNIIRDNYLENLYNAGILVYKTGHLIKGNFIAMSIGRCIRLEAAAGNNIIKGNNLGGGTALLIDDVSGVTTNKILRNFGYKTENNVNSPTFAIDSTGLKTVTIPHGLSITPNVEDIAITVNKNTNVTDWAYNLIIIDSVDATNVVIKINVSTASATGGATAKLSLRVGRQ